MTDRSVLIAPASEQERQLWRATIELVHLLDGIQWALIGRQMLTIIEREHGGDVGRATVDIDALVGIRASPLPATRLSPPPTGSRIGSCGAATSSTCWHRSASDGAPI